MSVSLTTIKRLYAKSSNRCALPQCGAPIIAHGIALGEICHIRARNRQGPRYDAALSAPDRDSYSNLLLLCRTCHKLVDSDPTTYTPALLADIKARHETEGSLEISPEVARDAQLLRQAPRQRSKALASVSGQGVAIAVGGDIHAPITVNQTKPGFARRPQYPSNSIGADANMAGYADYLFGLGVDYWDGSDTMTPGRLGKKIKDKFRLRSGRTRHHLPVQRFGELVDFIITEILAPSPAGRRHIRNGTKLCRTFNEWRYGPM